MQPSDSLASFGRGFGSPRRRPTSWTGAFLPIVSATSTCACKRASFGDESPALQKNRNLPRRSQGLPGYWAVLFVRAVVQHPAGYDPSSPLLLFEKIYEEAAIAFTENRTLGIRR